MKAVAENFMLSVDDLTGRSRKQRVVDARAAFVRLMAHEFDIPTHLSAEALMRSRWMGTVYSDISDVMIDDRMWRSAYSECVYQTTKGRSE